MAADLKDQVTDKVRSLPDDKQTDALRLLDSLSAEISSEHMEMVSDRRPIWEIVEELTPGYLWTHGRTSLPTAKSISTNT